MVQNVFFGDTSIPIYNQTMGIVGYCNYTAPLFTVTYSITGFLMGVCALYVISKGSAVLYVFATAFQLPLANLSFSVPFIMGNDTEPFSWWNVGGLVLVVVGFIVYGYFTAELRKQEAKEIT